MWPFKDQPDCVFDQFDEVVAEADLLILVPVGRFCELPFGFGVETASECH